MERILYGKDAQTERQGRMDSGGGIRWGKVVGKDDRRRVREKEGRR